MRINVDLKKCIGCGACELACSQKYNNSFRISRSRIQVDKGPEAVLKSKAFAVYVCHQCDDPPCIPSCPEGALFKDPITGVIKVDEDKCIGCSLCVQACPYNAIWVDPLKGKAFKCQLCDQTQQACVNICPRNALSIGGAQ
jgi:Fe-S-cluster-containing dehydrogenase component